MSAGRGRLALSKNGTFAGPLPWGFMPRFYFHLSNQIGFVPDEEGEEVADLDAAKLRAIENIRSILAGEVAEGRLDMNGSIQIAGANGAVIATVRFAEAVELYLEAGG